MLDRAWVRDHADEFDLLHVHFGYDAVPPEVLDALGVELERLGKPLVLTVHDLRNPHTLRLARSVPGSGRDRRRSELRGLPGPGSRAHVPVQRARRIDAGSCADAVERSLRAERPAPIPWTRRLEERCGIAERHVEIYRRSLTEVVPTGRSRRAAGR